MEKDKKKIIAGAGILVGTGLAYLLLKKPPQEGDKKCVGFNLHEYRQGDWVLVEENSTACGWQPEEETGIIQGYVVDRETGEHIPNAAIYLDGEFALYSWAADVGGYRIADIPYGAHTITVEADNYETTDFQIVVDRPIQSINLEMPPLPLIPGEWSEGVEVQKVFAEPEAAYLGEVVNIDVYIQYGIHESDTYPTPATIFGTVKVNGQELKKEFDINFRNPTLRFQYTASQVGEFTAIAQGKSTKFTVAESPVGTYYFPFGGVRVPRCVEFVIPDGWKDLDPGSIYSGQDLILPLDPSLAKQWGWLPCKAIGFFPSKWSPVVLLNISKETMLNGHPTKWEPSSVIVTEYDLRWDSNARGIVVVPAITDVPSFSCPPYWDTKEKLAQIIAQPKCTYMNLGGIIGGFYQFDGISPHLDPIRGVWDWVKPIKWKTDSIECPYCGKDVGHTARPYPYSPKQYLAIARKLLEHIESEHPDHPLTEPTW